MIKLRPVLSLTIMLLLFLSVPAFAKDVSIQQVSQDGLILKIMGCTENGGIIISGSASAFDKLVVRKDDFLKIYHLSPDNGTFTQKVFLTGGVGTYTIAIYKHLYDDKYQVGPQLKVAWNIELNEYLVPDQYIESDEEEIIALAQSLTKHKKTSLKKAKKLYQWVTKNINYDYDLLKEQEDNNYNNRYGALKALETRKGVCFDYAALYAALGRSVGLEVKLVKGWVTTADGPKYHAWNEVYIPEQDRWLILDTTFGATTGRNYFDCTTPQKAVS